MLLPSSLVVWNSDDVPHCRILSSDKAEWWLILAKLCRWRLCFLAEHWPVMVHDLHMRRRKRRNGLSSVISSSNGVWPGAFYCYNVPPSSIAAIWNTDIKYVHCFWHNSESKQDNLQCKHTLILSCSESHLQIASVFVRGSETVRTPHYHVFPGFTSNIDIKRTIWSRFARLIPIVFWFYCFKTFFCALCFFCAAIWRNKEWWYLLPELVYSLWI